MQNPGKLKSVSGLVSMRVISGSGMSDKAKTKTQKPGQFLPGNQFWKFRTKHGRDYKWQPDQLWDECVKYFQWCEDNPLMAAEVVKFQGEATLTQVPKMRAMTIQGLCYYLKTSDETWAAYKKHDDFSGIVHEAEQVIRDQKFTGAAADLLNANIIARELGLADKQDIQVKDVTKIKVKRSQADE